MQMIGGYALKALTVIPTPALNILQDNDAVNLDDNDGNPLEDN